LRSEILVFNFFEPLVHNWARLERLANATNDGSICAGLKHRISEIGSRTDKVETTQPTHALVILADDAKRKKALRLGARTEGIFPST
jgi:hypothetical protein